MMKMTPVVSVLLCSVILMPSMAQNLKGSIAEATSADSVSKEAEGQLKYEVATDSKSASPVSLHEDDDTDTEVKLPKKHPPTTQQALVAMALIFIIPAVGVVVMKKGKDSGWEGAFGLICGLITCVWIYTAVLDRWDDILGSSHMEWLDDAERISKSFLQSVTDVIVMAPMTMTDDLWSKLCTAKRLWGMFFALDNAAEYGHWVVDDKAKNIFRNNFNTALSEQGTLRMLKQIHTKELRAHFHPTELFKGELGQVSWAAARDLVKPVCEAMSSGGDFRSEVSPMLGVYNCYNCAKSPTGEPQQISDPLTVFEFLNFSKRYSQQDIESSFNPEDYMPVASYSPSLIMADHATTEQNYRAALDFAKSKGISAEKLQQAVRKEQVFVVKFTYEPLNNGMYAGHGLVKRMLPEYGKWLTGLLTSKPKLKAPDGLTSSTPILESTRQVFVHNLLNPVDDCAPSALPVCGHSNCNLM